MATLFLLITYVLLLLFIKKTTKPLTKKHEGQYLRNMRNIRKSKFIPH